MQCAYEPWGKLSLIILSSFYVFKLSYLAKKQKVTQKDTSDSPEHLTKINFEQKKR